MITKQVPVQKQRKARTPQPNPSTAAKAAGAVAAPTALALPMQFGNGAVQRWLAQRSGPVTDAFEPAGSTATAETEPATHPVLQRGSTGPEVVCLQTELNQAGAAPPLVEDGIFGEKTQAAVIAFQQDHALDVDGIVGPQTWAALDAVAPTPETDCAESVVESTTEPDEVHGFGPVAANVGNAKGAEANAIFQWILTKPPPGAEETVPGVPVSDLAKALIPDQLLPQVLNTAAVTSVSSFFAIRPGDLGTARAALLVLKLAVMEVSTKGALQPEQQQILLERIGDLDTFYASQVSEPAQAVNSQRQTVISIAMSQIGAVESWKGQGVDPNDPQKRQFRVGGERLLEYFRTAKPDPTGLYTESDVKHLTSDPAKPNENVTAWCGIFALWAYKSAGLSNSMWIPGNSINSIEDFKPAIKKNDVKPGDVGIVKLDLPNEKNSYHHFIVVEVKGDSLKTIEGNVDGGQIKTHSDRTISAAVFYRPTALR